MSAKGILHNILSSEWNFYLKTCVTFSLTFEDKKESKRKCPIDHILRAKCFYCDQIFNHYKIKGFSDQYEDTIYLTVLWCLLKEEFPRTINQGILLWRMNTRHFSSREVCENAFSRYVRTLARTCTRILRFGKWSWDLSTVWPNNNGPT